jgi:hypothetical protein
MDLDNPKVATNGDFLGGGVAGADLTYSWCTSADRSIAFSNAVQASILGATAPSDMSAEGCQSRIDTAPTPSPITLEALKKTPFICFNTDQGNIALFHVVAISSSDALTVEVTLWAKQ